MDLTKNYPRSVRDKFAGVVQLGRTVDKARAYVEGKTGEYHYNCGMDQAIFSFLGIADYEAFAKKISQFDDAQAEAWLRENYTSKKTQRELDEWSRNWLERGPEPGSDSYNYFIELRNQIAPDRTDVTSWPDLLDLDEHRDVPLRKAA